jgi:hypothetical protein
VEFSAAGQYGLQFWLNLDGANVFPGKMFVNIQSDSVAPYQQVVVSDGGVVPANQWTHVAMTYDLTNGTVRLYANGVQVANGIAPIAPKVDFPMSFGFRTNGDHLAGLLDEMTVYDQVLTPEAIQDIYFAGSEGKTGAQMAPDMTSAVTATNSLSVNQRGLFTQTVSINNPTVKSFSAVRLLVALDAASVAAGVRIYNATGTNAAGTPFLQYNQPLAPGKSVDFVVEYYIPDRRTVPAPTFAADVVIADAPLDPVGTALAIDRVVAMTDGSRMVEFSTLTNRTYYLQYTSDMTHWKTAQPAVLGTGSRVQWFDNGPPKTESLPDTETMRIYRIILVP